MDSDVKLPAKSDNLCHCGSGSSYGTCCGIYISGVKPAPSPEALMRSRYTAFCLNDLGYLRHTWHPDTLPELCDDEPSNWVGLEILSTEIDGDTGLVEFKAKLIHEGKLEVLHEESDFEKIAGRWVYHSGIFKNPNASPIKIGRKSPCPCNSGEIFKHCHGKKN